MNLGQRISKLRAEKNLSQGDLADILEVSRQSISKWETNASVPELDKLIKLSELFGLSLDELVTGKAPCTSTAENTTSESEPQVIYIEKPSKPVLCAAQIFGIILLSCALLCFILFACFGDSYDLFEVFALCFPVALIGFLCLLAKHPLLWCSWCGSATWWIYQFILLRNSPLLLLIGIFLVVIALIYTIYLHKSKRIFVPPWLWALLTIILAGAALLLMLNLLPMERIFIHSASEMPQPVGSIPYE